MRTFADAGNTKAQMWMGMMFQHKANYQEAMNWYSLAGNKGEAWAISQAARLHERGLGTPINKAAAAEWYKKGAEFGHANHQTNYAWALMRGEGVEKNEDKAFEWLSKAAEQKDSLAYLYLAEIYSNDTTSKRDAIKSYAYAKMFENHPIDDSDTASIKDAIRIQNSMKKEMTKDQLQAANKLVEELDSK